MQVVFLQCSGHVSDLSAHDTVNIEVCGVSWQGLVPDAIQLAVRQHHTPGDSGWEGYWLYHLTDGAQVGLHRLTALLLKHVPDADTGEVMVIFLTPGVGTHRAETVLVLLLSHFLHHPHLTSVGDVRVDHRAWLRTA